MIHRVRRHQAVERDIREIAKFIGRSSPAAARRFLANADDSIVGLRYMPGQGSPKALRRVKHGEARTLAVRGISNHLIVYQIRPEGVHVLAVVDGHRNYLPLLRQRLAPPSSE